MGARRDFEGVILGQVEGSRGAVANVRKAAPPLSSTAGETPPAAALGFDRPRSAAASKAVGRFPRCWVGAAQAHALRARAPGLASHAARPPRRGASGHSARRALAPWWPFLPQQREGATSRFRWAGGGLSVRWPGGRVQRTRRPTELWKAGLAFTQHPTRVCGSP